MSIKNFTGEITQITDLSKTAREISVTLSEPISFLPGSFLNVFVDVNEEKIRRAYSISSSLNDHNTITLTMRLSPSGIVTPFFWSKDMVGVSIGLMGPLGQNTVDKMTHDKIYLFAFGVGCGVVKSIADYFSTFKKVEKLTIITGSRTEDEILYKDYFNNLAINSDKISVLHVVSKVDESSVVPQGYIQDFISDLDFNNSDVYVCGQGVACDALVTKIKSMEPNDCSFFIEAFH